MSELLVCYAYRIWPRLAALGLGWLLYVVPVGPAFGAEDEYRIEVGDTVSVIVYGEPDLDVRDSRVNSSGRVSVPLIGNVTVRGRTETEVRDEVTKRFADGYLKKPNITVNVDRLQLYYIKGEVKKPGGYRYVDGLSVEKAVALAGGLTERAAEDEITVSSHASPGKARRGVGMSAEVSPGDVITVGESFF